ncbi:hypothetical protein DASB73_015470 [Starmerella bacillaris]|uniref:Uncharacterized protein n=1 Tax=Starmerella bacillaris TaxID=1247836 RepID=A0AAV5RG73_STABA|nr:hypothetical protein DASB73_015470 [Starmerella bacillaris]
MSGRKVFNREEKLKPLVKALQKVYPTQLSDDWDNTGLLLDCSDTEQGASAELRVLLTADITDEVCKEAIKNRIDCLVTYHPLIFDGIKRLEKSNSQHRTIMNLIREKISVYSPHTAADAAVGGVNDWLAKCVAFGADNILQMSTIKPCTNIIPAGFEGAGYGRYVILREPQTLSVLVEHVRKRLRMKHVPLIKATKHDTDLIATIAVCAGSGGSVLKGVKADLVVTGELGHHDQLRLREQGTSCIVTGHWNSEAGFLGIFAEHLAQQLSALGAAAPNAKIMISQEDRSPMEYV